jgi:FkbM family methyltransferase
MTAAKSLAGTVRGSIKAFVPESLILRNLVQRELKQGDPELRIVHCLSSRSEIAMDVGANRGAYALLFSRYCDHVFALEPHPLMVERLHKSLPKSVRILNIAASDQEGECAFHIPVHAGHDLDTRCSLEADVNGEFRTRTILVERRRLDQLPLDGRSVGVIKIDVEGHELSTLHGMTGLIAQSRPSVIIESEARHHAGAPGNVFQFFESLRYEGYFIHRGMLRPINEFSVEEFQSHGVEKAVDDRKSPDYINNFLFVHPSRNAALEQIKRVFPMSGARVTVGAA